MKVAVGPKQSMHAVLNGQLQATQDTNTARSSGARDAHPPKRCNDAAAEYLNGSDCP